MRSWHSGQHPGTPGPFTGRLHRNRRRSKGPAWWSTGFRPSLVLAREGAHRIWSAGGVPCRGRLAQGRQYAPSTARPEPRSGGRGAGGSSRVRCRCQACGLSTQSNAGTRLFHAGIGVCVGMGGGGWPARCTSGYLRCTLRVPAMYLEGSRLAATDDIHAATAPRSCAASARLTCGFPARGLRVRFILLYEVSGCTGECRAMPVRARHGD